jgi:hypothetical protein
MAGSAFLSTAQSLSSERLTQETKTTVNTRPSRQLPTMCTNKVEVICEGCLRDDALDPGNCLSRAGKFPRPAPKLERSSAQGNVTSPGSDPSSLEGCVTLHYFMLCFLEHGTEVQLGVLPMFFQTLILALETLQFFRILDS